MARDEQRGNGVVRRTDPLTQTKLGVSKIPSHEVCHDYEYTQTEITYEQSEPYETQHLEPLNPSNPRSHWEYVYYTNIDIYQVTTITTWLENSCSPGEKRNIVSTTNKTLYGTRTQKGRNIPTVSHPDPTDYYTRNIPQHIPDHVAAILAGGGLGTGWLKYYGVKPDPDRGRNQSSSVSTPNETTDVKSSQVESKEDQSNRDPGNPDLRLSFYGYDRSDDESAHLNEGPGFNYRDREVKEVSIGSTITREDLSSAKITHNGHIPNNWDEAIVVGASFQPLSSVPTDFQTYSVTYGYWILHLKPKWE